MNVKNLFNIQVEGRSSFNKMIYKGVVISEDAVLFHNDYGYSVQILTEENEIHLIDLEGLKVLQNLKLN
jgi:hypothetical protein